MKFLRLKAHFVSYKRGVFRTLSNVQDAEFVKIDNR